MTNRTIVATSHGYELEYRPGIGYQIWGPPGSPELTVDTQYRNVYKKDPDRLTHTIRITPYFRNHLTPGEMEDYANRALVAAQAATNLQKYFDETRQ